MKFKKIAVDPVAKGAVVAQWTRPQTQPYRPIYIGKTKILLYRLHCQKNPYLFGFWQEKRMREKTRISYWFFGKWCACATSLYLWLYVVRSTSRAAGDSAEGHVTRDQKPE